LENQNKKSSNLFYQEKEGEGEEEEVCLI